MAEPLDAEKTKEKTQIFKNVQQTTTLVKS